MTLGASVIFSVTFHAIYGYLHPYLPLSIYLFAISAVIESFIETLNVEPVLSFNYKLLALSEALIFTLNTALLYGFIKFFDLDPILSFGMAYLTAHVAQALIYLFFYLNDYKIDLKLKKITSELGSSFLVHKQTKKLALQLCVMPLVTTYSQQLYFIVFLAGSKFLGVYSLLISLGGLFKRYVFAPVDVKIFFKKKQVTFNLYSKLIGKSFELEGIKRKEVQKKVLKIAEFVVFVWVYCLYFFLSYGLPSASFIMKNILGQSWTKSGVRSSLIQILVRSLRVYLLVIWLEGISGQLKNLGRSIFSEKELRSFNISNIILIW